MKLENHICSLEPSKKLKELGVKQESLFWWNVFIDPRTGKRKRILDYDLSKTFGDYYSAYTVAELGEMLPVGFFTCKHTIRWECCNSMIQYDNWREGISNTLTLKYADTEADARAQMLIYLIENKLI